MSKSNGAVFNESYRDLKLIDEVKKKYKSLIPCKFENYELITTPFRLLKLSEVIKDNAFLKILQKDLLNLDYVRKDNDLYNLQQSADLNSCTVDSITQFVHLLRSKIEPLLANIIGVTFNGTLSITASLYKSGEYLLCHDDRCDDRCVAFVYYVTESIAEAGGHFRMFDHD
uniref:2OG-FeII_Oxy_4 domain-containing protein n=1 Tax=Rhodnius prolixus TaxID=13249 RepID=T1I8R0_RHOPR